MLEEKGSFSFVIRPISPSDEPVLWEMLYHAIYVPESSPPPPRQIVNTPELSRYVSGWGRAGDMGLLASAAGDQPAIGAAWLRSFQKNDPGYGYVDEETPELSIAILPQYRGRGVGTGLLRQLIERAERTYKAVSLSVSADNPAVRLYEREGFEVVSDDGRSLVMKRAGMRMSLEAF